jgi:hypothetical protein
MRNKPTFSLVDDYVALMELGPAARTVYMLLRCNAHFTRNGVADHSVHVTASWFTEMTAHWQKPLAAASARRGLNELINKGVLIRLNEPQDGSGFVVAFVVDPRGRIEGPTNGYEQAKKVAKRCGMKVYYERKEGMPGTPAVTGVRLGPQRDYEAKAAARWAEKEQSASGEPEESTPAAHEDHDEPDLFSEPSAEDTPEPKPTPRRASAKREVTPEVGELARLLVQKCHGKGLNRQGLLEGEALRVAEACTDALELGWKPDQISNKLSALVSTGIHSTEAFLLKKVSDLGAPPAAAHSDGSVLVNGKPVDLGSISWNDLPGTVARAEEEPQPALPPSTDSNEKATRLAQLARQQRRYL